MEKREDGGIYVEYMDISKVRGALRNPKDHDIGELIRSIEEFGYVTPGIIDERTGRLVKGHGSRDALRVIKGNGGKVPRNIQVERGEAGEEVWKWPVVRGVEFGSDEEAEAFIIADNQITMLGGWDEALLAEVLADLAAVDRLVGVGFEEGEVDEIIKRVMGDTGRDEAGAAAEDEREEQGAYGEEQAQEAQRVWEVEEGDVWVIGEQVVICDDCRDWNSWRKGLAILGRNKVNGIVTSPPYAEQRMGNFGVREGEKRRGYGGIKESEYVEWWQPVQEHARRSLALDGSFFLNIKPHVKEGEMVLYVFDLVLAMARDWEWSLIEEYCWERTTQPGSWPNRFKNGFEPVYHFGVQPKVKFRPDSVKGDRPGSFERHSYNENTGDYFNTSDTYFEWDGALPSNRLPIRGNVGRVGHEAAFTWRLPEFFIRAFSDPGDVWVDPFAGSSSTLVAAHYNQRAGIAIEQVPAFAALSVERLAQVTGLEPKKA